VNHPPRSRTPLRAATIALAALPACDWVFEPSDPADTGFIDTISSDAECGSLEIASDASLFLGSFDVDNTAYRPALALDPNEAPVACASRGDDAGLWVFTLDGAYAGSLRIEAPAGLYAFPGAPVPLLEVVLDGEAFRPAQYWSSWGSGNVQVSEESGTYTVNLANVASETFEPSLFLQGSLTVKR
jgi:hypothetical protein